MKQIPLAIIFAISAIFICACAGNTAPQKKERKIAVQTYTFHKFTLDETISMLKETDLRALECWNEQRLSAKFPGAKFNAKMTPEQKEFAKSLIFGNGFKIVSMGVTGANSEAEIVSLCKFAKEFDIPIIVTESSKEMLPLWEKACEEYGIKMSIHNHQRGSGNEYYKPELVMEMVRPYKNIGCCPDNGAWSRSGLDPVACFKTMKGKIFNVHFKDQKVFNDLASPAVIYGTGVLDMKGMLAELDAQGYDGYYVIEHGDDSDNPLPVVKADIEFLKNN